MRFRNLILMGSVLSFMVSCNHTLDVNSLPKSVIEQINDTLTVEMEGKEISMKLSNGRCLSVYRTPPGFFAPQPYDIACEDQDSLGDLKFSFSGGVFEDDAGIYFKISSGGFRTQYYHLNSIDINKNCEIEAVKLVNNTIVGTKEIPFPTQELSLANEKLFEGKKVGRYHRLDGVEKNWSVVHTNDESLEAANQLFFLLKEKIQSTLESLSETEMEELGISKKAKKRCVKIK